MTALHVFDMDGTLLRGTTASREICRRLDRIAEIDELERRFRGREITDAQFAVGVHGLWSTLHTELVDDIADGAPWIDGIAEVCADIAARGETSMLITLSPDFFARHLLRLGVDVVHGSAFPPLPFTAPVDPAAILTPADKVRITEAERAARHLSTNACVAYGDSRSDEPLFAHLTHTIAVNADPVVEALARVTYRGDDLREPYAQARRLLDGDGPTGTYTR
ncbi:haloacid dehalogenase-like hydrolase [Actinomycetospora endophytica]|uniref:Haloacid dehalogenase-like hydrolase n=1 Tax=Actinomycetospora endophytica TaxID=2291215 RepID=A0ABS8PEL8_9PSEU|nr:haloacid dehalogenase-like hydrolase [Actinomycetospora endophytica]MCD2196711.1 haloacid dehalogenase-like hydrolase [Actinomycetospora endophytica]